MDMHDFINNKTKTQKILYSLKDIQQRANLDFESKSLSPKILYSSIQHEA